MLRDIGLRKYIWHVKVMSDPSFSSISRRVTNNRPAIEMARLNNRATKKSRGANGHLITTWNNNNKKAKANVRKVQAQLLMNHPDLRESTQRFLSSENKDPRKIEMQSVLEQAEKQLLEQRRQRASRSRSRRPRSSKSRPRTPRLPFIRTGMSRIRKILTKQPQPQPPRKDHHIPLHLSNRMKLERKMKNEIFDAKMGDPEYVERYANSPEFQKLLNFVSVNRRNVFTINLPNGIKPNQWKKLVLLAANAAKAQGRRTLLMNTNPDSFYTLVQIPREFQVLDKGLRDVTHDRDIAMIASRSKYKAQLKSPRPLRIKSLDNAVDR